MKKFILKWLTVPESNRTREVEAVQMWEVRWWSVALRYGPQMAICSTSPELECFTSEEEANAFVTSLTNALALLRNTGLKVEVRRAA